jgi:prepilin-type N-terminal cleavage/methylation domain-containing protein
MESGCKRSGFTLIELLIVVSIIAILASIALPSFVRSRAQANEGAIIATVRSIAEAQFQFKTLSLVDLDRNNAYEFGTLGEITGSRYLRGSVEKLAPRLLSESLGAVNALGRLSRHGYLLALYLPDAAGKGLAETATNLPNIDPGLSADYWTLVAWPESDSSGAATFFVNQQGQIMKTHAPYVGTSQVPAPGCALVGVAPDEINSQTLAVGQPGADGNNWVVAN